MNIFFLLLIAISLAMDSFAVSVGLGIKHPEYKRRYAVKIAFIFGLFHVLAPLIGWFMAEHIYSVISNYDHWVIFGILVIVGIRMIHQGYLSKNSKAQCIKNCESIKNLCLIAIAISIDALAVGFSLSLLGLEVFVSCLIIGSVTFILSFIGAELGDKIGAKIKHRAEILGGTILILIGLKVLIGHFFF